MRARRRASHPRSWVKVGGAGAPCRPPPGVRRWRSDRGPMTGHPGGILLPSPGGGLAWHWEEAGLARDAQLWGKGEAEGSTTV